jgi:hypothetical protein
MRSVMHYYAQCRTILFNGVIFRLIFFDSTVIVYKQESLLIFWVCISLGSLISGTKIAFWIILWQGSLGGSFLLTSADISSALMLESHTAMAALSYVERQEPMYLSKDYTSDAKCHPTLFPLS